MARRPTLRRRPLRTPQARFRGRVYKTVFAVQMGSSIVAGTVVMAAVLLGLVWITGRSPDGRRNPALGIWLAEVSEHWPWYLATCLASALLALALEPLRKNLRRRWRDDLLGLP